MEKINFPPFRRFDSRVRGRALTRAFLIFEIGHARNRILIGKGAKDTEREKIINIRHPCRNLALGAERPRCDGFCYQETLHALCLFFSFFNSFTHVFSADPAITKTCGKFHKFLNNVLVVLAFLIRLLFGNFFKIRGFLRTKVYTYYSLKVR